MNFDLYIMNLCYRTKGLLQLIYETLMTVKIFEPLLAWDDDNSSEKFDFFTRVTFHNGFIDENHVEFVWWIRPLLKKLNTF